MWQTSLPKLLGMVEYIWILCLCAPWCLHMSALITYDMWERYAKIGCQSEDDLWHLLIEEVIGGGFYMDLRRINCWMLAYSVPLASCTLSHWNWSSTLSYGAVKIVSFRKWLALFSGSHVALFADLWAGVTNRNSYIDLQRFRKGHGPLGYLVLAGESATS